MDLARVEGTIVSTAKNERLKSRKLLLVNLIEPDLKPSKNYLVAVDSVGAGTGEIVLVVKGSSARQSADLANVPTDASIVGIVDSIEHLGIVKFRKSDK
ncbi:MAG: EutN/CcmL family microcompartment protein [Ignavibacteriales bacterium]|nr:EutN/CcmL family microcompartment protein [Ignavibacteriales bacterium]MCB9218125.1 EutN/CcmL family microcompartment protein [Ignavibacteriales bacterium]MCB9260514.1 EutN/CcmL family microcompartment protein [Ignavibacteriales bacterium]